MTGFGAAAGTIDGVEYAIELRSVNNRFFKAYVRLPEPLSAVESQVEQRLREQLHRGTVNVSIQMRLPDDLAAGRINTAVLSSYLEQLRPVEVEANPMMRIDLSALLELPGVCQPPEIDELLEATRAGMFDLLEKAVSALVEMRSREGRALREELLGHCAAVEEHLAAVEALAPQVVVDYQQRLAARVEDLLRQGKVQIDQDQLAREVAIFAERCDVTEEIARLKHHLGQFRGSLDGDGPVGRKLDFIAQEMLREANTIASKAASGEIAGRVVEIKAGIDRIKEQVQNVE